jgi:hypothetical protein
VRRTTFQRTVFCSVESYRTTTDVFHFLTSRTDHTLTVAILTQ